MKCPRCESKCIEIILDEKTPTVIEKECQACWFRWYDIGKTILSISYSEDVVEY
jgi:hypothetical protein